MSARASRYRVGIDVGGTFTDSALLDDAGNLFVAKVPTTPTDFALGVLSALDDVANQVGVPPSAIDYLLHGSTVATNAIVTDSIARTGLLTTSGCRDVLEIGTQQRASLYDLRKPLAPPIVPRHLRLEAEERIGADGSIVRSLKLADVEQAAREFAAAAVEAVAIAFLFSFANPSHEQQARDLLQSLLPGVPIAISSEVAPEFREFLRTSTTALNASLLPLVGTYLMHLRHQAAERGFSGSLLMMCSNGGLAPIDKAAETPVSLVASGPAAGVIGASGIAARAGRRDLLTFDMGGTTADVAVVLNGQPQLSFRGEACGYPLSLPQMDILSVGAGGGSIASVDRFGALKVGPQSAGAEPGPACYGQGGTHPTVTDAHLVLGTLKGGRVLGGSIVLDPDLARSAIEEHVARPLDCDIDTAAQAILRVANAKMATALRIMSVSRGHDPRSLTLVAYGGAGPMHAAALAEELGINEILIPPAPGAASALGLLLSDVLYDLTQPLIGSERTIDATAVKSCLERISNAATERLVATGIRNGQSRVELALDLRYRGQAYELTIPIRDAHEDGQGVLSQAKTRFHDTHRAIYGHDLPGSEIEVVTVRARAIGSVADAVTEVRRAVATRLDRTDDARTILVSPSHYEDYLVLNRGELDRGKTIRGPLVLDDEGSTVVVPRGWIASRGRHDSVTLRRGGEDARIYG
jgi:N-methylhydantoinase A